MGTELLLELSGECQAYLLNYNNILNKYSSASNNNILSIVRNLHLLFL